MSVSKRRAEIIRILRGTKQTTIFRLSETLGVCVKTISNDILALTVDEGYPIDTFRGNGGGIVLNELSHPHKHILSQEQIAVLIEIMRTTSNTYHAEILEGILKAYA